MVLKVKTDVRIFLLKVNWYVIAGIIVYSFFYLYHGRIKLSPLLPFLIGTVISSIESFFSAKRIHLQNSYLYLKNNKEEPNSLKDIPIKPTDISGYMLNNPFPKLSKWCDSSKNITLFLNNGKYIILSAKDQELFLMKWLKENYIREESRVSKRGIIETGIITILSLCIFLFYLLLYKNDALNNSDFLYLITSTVCLAYNLIYIITGLVLKRRESFLEK